MALSYVGINQTPKTLLIDHNGFTGRMWKTYDRATCFGQAAPSVMSVSEAIENFNMIAADVNGDGIVDTLDRMIVNRYLANWEGYNSLPYSN